MAVYKYNCRKCPIRNRCVDQSANSPSIKEIIRHAFVARTDTLETWGLLQPNCLLMKAEQDRASMAPRESMLSRRLRQAREARKQASQALSPSPDKQPDYLQPVSPPPPSRGGSSPEESPLGVMEGEDEAPPFSQEADLRHSRPCWLTVRASGRHIALPTTGQLVLGRFDPHFGIPPDVDLTYEDQGTNSVSRRHARIIGADWVHKIEDLGSRHGLFLNGDLLKPGSAQSLRPGYNVTLGNVQLVYEVMPAHLLDLSSIVTATVRHILTITPTGRPITIGPPNDVIIGRSDRYINFVPDIDLSREGDLAVRVSRRHAIITWRNHSPYLEDLGSGFGTRLNGATLLIGQSVPLKPGDHIWLGGCVLAYDLAF